MEIKITGLLRENNSENSLSGLYVEAYNEAHTVWLGGAKSDINGRFTFYLREDVDAVSFPVLLVVYRNNIPYHTTKLTAPESEYLITLSSLNERAADATHEQLDTDKDFFIIYGTLKDAAGRLMPAEKIAVSASGFRSKTRITYTETDHKGRYSVKVARASLNNEETTGERSVLVEAVRIVEGSDTAFATSGDLFDIPLKLEVGLQSMDGSFVNGIEYDRLHAAIENALPIEDAITGITIEGDDRESIYLAKLINEDESRVIMLVKAFVYAAELAIHPELAYGLLRAADNIDKKTTFNRTETALRNAITSSENNGTINELSTDWIDQDITKILNWQIGEVTQIEFDTEEMTVEELFTATFDNETYLNNLLAASRSFEGDSVQTFWAQFETTYGTGQRERIQKGLQLLTITGLQPKMTNYLLNPANFNNGDLEFNGNVKDLAKWSKQDWEHVINAAGDVEAIPKSISPNRNPDDIPVYAEKLQNVVGSLYPTTAMAARIADNAALLDIPAMQTTVTTFLSNNPNYDFRNQSIYDLNAEDYNLTGVAELDDLKAELAPFQRLARLTGGNPQAMSVLKTANLTSAHAIVNAMGLNQFVSTYGTQLGGAVAAATYYNTATTISNVANHAAVAVAQADHHIPYVLGGNQPVDPSVSPDLASLFESLEMCGCEYCMSLYSPSAYYADILKFVKDSSVSPSAFDELKRRRPDLTYIDLTCKNANTPLPYIDLVNELLELEILRRKLGAPGFPTELPLSYQTEAEAAELAAHPEHLAKLLIPNSSPLDYKYENSNDYRSVYDKVLNTEQYSAILPFNLAWEEARVYLQHLGKSRYELMKLFKPLDAGFYEETSGSQPDKVTRKNTLGEYLGISKQTSEHITNTSLLPADIAPYYGLDSNNPNNTLLSPSNSSIILSGSWNDLLTGNNNITDGGIDVLLSRLDISYKELLQLLTTESLNKRDNGVRVARIMAKSTDPDDQATCVLKELQLDIQPPHTIEKFFSALHRFVRLWRATKLSIYELDIVLNSLNISVFNATFLTPAEYTLTLQAIAFARQFNLSVEEMTTWWSDISEVQYTNYNTEYQDALPSFFDKLFKSKLLKNPPDISFDDIRAMSYAEVYVNHIPSVLSAAGISEEELRLLTGNSMLSIDLSGVMTVPGLTAIFREAMAARILGISIKDLTRIYTLLNINPAASLSKEQRQKHLEDLIAFVDTLNSSRFSISEWEYLIKNDDDVAQLTPAGDEQFRFHESLQAELYKVAAVLDTLVSTDDLDPVDDAGQIDEIKKQQANIKNQLKNILIQKYVTEFGLNAAIVQYLLENVMSFKAADNSDAPLLDIFISDGFYKEELTTTPPNNFIASYVHGTALPTTVSFSLLDMYDVYLRFAKIALIANRLKLKKEEFEILQENNSIASVINVLSLEGLASVSLPNTIENFISYINWIKVRDLLNVTGADFSELIDDLLTAPAPSNWVNTLVAASQWDQSAVEELVSTGGDGELHVTFSTDAKQASLILRIAAILQACAVIGISPQEFKRNNGTLRSILWADLEMDDSEKIIKTARAKYTEAAWNKIAKPLRDELREKQRKALVAYLLANPAPTSGAGNQRWRNENELYAYFLIDVETSPCMKTSRTKQAISSVQLFVDRVMMNLEYENQMPWVSGTLLSIDPDEIREWKTWRKWYRIWEANRKIFLYPENWIEPELRDGKSPEFVEFETHLMQDDVTPGLVEEAYIDYLEKLDDFARLEPVTNYHEFEPATETEVGVDIIHAFARTHVQPHHYYYRRFEKNEWTPWERIELDIKGDHFTAYVKNKRLYIFWLTFIEKQTANDADGKSKGKMIVDRQGTTGTLSGRLSSLSDQALVAAWEKTTWLGSTFAFYRQPGSTILDIAKSDDLSKKWDIYLNWSEYKDQKWQKSKISKEKIELIPHLVTISTSAEASVTAEKNKLPYSGNPTSSYAYTLDFLTRNGEITPNELFRNRIYLAPGTWQNELYMSLQLTDGLDEYCVGIHAFRFTEDMRDVVVLRTDELEYSTKAPNDTLISNNKFIESPVGGSKKLWTSTTARTADSHYGYTFKRMELSSRIGNTSSAAILDLTSKGTYKLAAKSNLPDIGNWGVDSPTLNHFFFEDDVNTYFVKRVYQPFSAEVLTGEATYQGPLFNPEQTTFVALLQSIEGIYPVQATTSDNTGILQLLNNFNVAAPANPPATSAVHATVGSEYYKFETFYHPHANNFIKKINTEGVKGLLNIATQSKTDSMHFQATYQPTSLVYHQHPTDIVDFDYGASYSLYNWELFFHMPMTIAQRLSNNQQFEEAQKWYHYIFDPTSNVDDTGKNISNGKERFWRFRPFYEFTGQQSAATTSQMVANMYSYKDQVDAWEQNPFKPHVIARMRIMAYMKNVVMKYIDNLIAWGDQLFRRDTIESINEATQLYILAANILGDRPQEIPARAKAEKSCFEELLAAGLDPFSNAKVQIEAFMGPNVSNAAITTSAGIGFSHPNAPIMSPVPSLGNMSYFCLSNNDKLLGYWDTVADRLFKIRNCRNIDGVLRELPLYEPPIDPALLLKAAAAGVDINSVLDAQAGIGMPHYRFQYVLQKANELCADVRGLGSAVLAALEKKDAEALALLRSGHELTVMEKVKTVKEAQVKEAEEGLNGLLKTREATEIRQRYYSSRQFMNSGETQHLQSIQTGMVLQAIQGGMQSVGSSLSLIPQFHIQAPFAVGPGFGGQQLSTAMTILSQNVGIASSIVSAKGNMAQVKAGYERRMDDWKFQAETAAKELEQIDKQLIGAEIRLNIAQKELENHELQMENSKEADEYMRSKFTNVELYNWMLGQLATVYFQSYQLAYDLAKKAESCYDYELPHAKDKKPATGFIKFGYWDSLRKGLLAGEKLQFDLRKMDASYMEQNKRELELTKHVSLALMDPQSLLDLRKDGYCYMMVSEEMYDLDYPGHYNRRLKSVSISIPCIAGPYTTVPAKLQLEKNAIRTTPEITAAITPDANTVIPFIATSNAQNDSGTFELNFRDERYLPFEGRGAVSLWKLTLAEGDQVRLFDFDTIADVILHVKYTANDAGDPFKSSVVAEINKLFNLLTSEYAENHDVFPNYTPLPALPRYFSLKHEFSNDWYAYAKKANEATSVAEVLLEHKVKKDQYPFFCQGKNVLLQTAVPVIRFKQPSSAGNVTIELHDDSIASPMTLTKSITAGEVLIDMGAINIASGIPLGETQLKWKIKIDGSVVDIDQTFDDIYLITYYKLSTT